MLRIIAAICEPGTRLNTSSALSEQSAVWNKASSDQKNAINAALCYGYAGYSLSDAKKAGLPSNITDAQFAEATQRLVWEFIGKCRDATFPYTHRQDDMINAKGNKINPSDYTNHGGKNTTTAAKWIIAQMCNANRLPTYANAVEDKCQTITLTATYDPNTNKWTYESRSVPDGNNVVGNFTVNRMGYSGSTPTGWEPASFVDCQNAKVKVTPSSNALKLEVYDGVLNADKTAGVSGVTKTLKHINKLPNKTIDGGIITYGDNHAYDGYGIQDVVGKGSTKSLDGYLHVNVKINVKEVENRDFRIRKNVVGVDEFAANVDPDNSALANKETLAIYTIPYDEGWYFDWPYGEEIEFADGQTGKVTDYKELINHCMALEITMKNKKCNIFYPCINDRDFVFKKPESQKMMQDERINIADIEEIYQAWNNGLL